MYCSTCAAAIPQNLTYCNRCGARVGAKGDELAKPIGFYPESLIWAIVAVFIGGIGVLIGLIAVMREVAGFDLSMVWAVTMISFMMMLGIEGVLIYMFFSGRKTAKQLISGSRLKEQKTKELEEASIPLLPEPVPSVTEQTTRSFEPVYNKQR
jgi:hypothetical protein